jgi:hypothetical protein
MNIGSSVELKLKNQKRKSKRFDPVAVFSSQYRNKEEMKEAKALEKRRVSIMTENLRRIQESERLEKRARDIENLARERSFFDDDGEALGGYDGHCEETEHVERIKNFTKQWDEKKDSIRDLYLRSLDLHGEPKGEIIDYVDEKCGKCVENEKTVIKAFFFHGKP